MSKEFSKAHLFVIYKFNFPIDSVNMYFICANYSEFFLNMLIDGSLCRRVVVCINLYGCFVKCEKNLCSLAPILLWINSL